MTIGEFKKYIQENEIHDDVKLLIPGIDRIAAAEGNLAEMVSAYKEMEECE